MQSTVCFVIFPFPFPADFIISSRCSSLQIHNMIYLSEVNSDLDYFCLKVPKREIFDRSDFPDFYTMKSLRVGDFGVKIKKNFTNI
jgi:hypothetical protein